MATAACLLAADLRGGTELVEAEFEVFDPHKLLVRRD
jgi:hypothetical protein